MNVLTSIVDSAMTMPTASTSNRMPAPARIFHTVRMCRFYLSGNVPGGAGREQAFGGGGFVPVRRRLVAVGRRFVG